jgi:hypothetical protein
MGAAAPILSLASVGFSAAGSLVGAQGTSAADKYQAEQFKRDAAYGELKATQTNADLTRNLTMTLGHIDAIRAAGRLDPTSPTSAAVRGQAEEIGTEQKNIKVDSLLAQAQQDEAAASYMRQASSVALLGGGVGALAGILGKNGFAGLPSLQGGGAPLQLQGAVP